MSDLLVWVSFALQVYSTIWPRWPSKVRKTRVVKGRVEINLGFYRRQVSWTEEHHIQR